MPSTAWKQFDPRQTNSGPGRLAVSPTPLTADPVAMNPGTGQGIMDPATYTFIAPFADVGATEGGINIIRGTAQQAYRVDQSDGDFKTEITDNTVRVETNIAQLGDIEKFVMVWMADSATAQVPTTLERIKGIATQRLYIHHSLVLMELDEANLLRAYYLRDVSNEAGDVQVSIATAALHAAPLHLRGYPSTTVAIGKEFGFIMEQDGFGGITGV